jgi:hypothetical protein
MWSAGPAPSPWAPLHTARLLAAKGREKRLGALAAAGSGCCGVVGPSCTRLMLALCGAAGMAAPSAFPAAARRRGRRHSLNTSLSSARWAGRPDTPAGVRVASPSPRAADFSSQLGVTGPGVSGTRLPASLDLGGGVNRPAAVQSGGQQFNSRMQDQAASSPHAGGRARRSLQATGACTHRALQAPQRACASSAAMPGWRAPAASTRVALSPACGRQACGCRAHNAPVSPCSTVWERASRCDLCAASCGRVAWTMMETIGELTGLCAGIARAL